MGFPNTDRNPGGDRVVDGGGTRYRHLSSSTLPLTPGRETPLAQGPSAPDPPLRPTSGFKGETGLGGVVPPRAPLWGGSHGSEAQTVGHGVIAPAVEPPEGLGVQEVDGEPVGVDAVPTHTPS